MSEGYEKIRKLVDESPQVDVTGHPISASVPVSPRDSSSMNIVGHIDVWRC